MQSDHDSALVAKVMTFAASSVKVRYITFRRHGLVKVKIKENYKLDYQLLYLKV